MMGSLQEQLLKAGLITAERLTEMERAREPKKSAAPKPAAKNRSVANKNGKDRRGKIPGLKNTELKNAGQGKAAKPSSPNVDSERPRQAGRKRSTAPPSSGDISLEEAWRRRRASEKSLAAARLQEKLADEKARHERNLKLEALVAGSILNDPEATEPRYFLYRGKIRHVHVTPAQRAAMSRDEMGILVLRSRFLVLPQEILARCAEIAPDLIPDLGSDLDSPEIDSAE